MLAILAGALTFLLGLRVFGRSYSSTRWPVTHGRILSSRLAAADDGRYRALVQYEFILAGKVYRGSGLHRPSAGGTGDSTSGPLLPRAEAESLIAAYPAGREIAVGFDPGDPAQSVLRPRIRWWSLAVTGTGAALLAMGIWLGRCRLLRRTQA
jgi:hypothetical protein